MTIPTLIDKQDNVEIIRDQIAGILALEIASQKVLATAAAKNPDDWNMNVYTERSNPWEQWQNDQSDFSPIVNVWWDNSNFDMKAGNVVDRQKSTAVFNIDCYGFGKSADNPSGGHIPGDRKAALEAARAVRLVRNILMAAEYTYLGLRGVVWRRWPQGITNFQPQQENAAAQQIVGARLPLSVDFNELSPQVASEILEFVSVSIIHKGDGELIVLSGEALAESGEPEAVSGNFIINMVTDVADYDYT